MSIEDFIIAIFYLVEDELQKMLKGKIVQSVAVSSSISL